jgi:hypothetical protein
MFLFYHNWTVKWRTAEFKSQKIDPVHNHFGDCPVSISVVLRPSVSLSALGNGQLSIHLYPKFVFVIFVIYWCVKFDIRHSVLLVVVGPAGRPARPRLTAETGRLSVCFWEVIWYFIEERDISFPLYSFSLSLSFTGITGSTLLARSFAYNKR